jgi:hypothetical protein
VGTAVANARSAAKRPQGRLKTAFWLDVALLISVSALQTVRFTGLVIHEWLGLALVLIVFAHLVFAWSWIASNSRRLFTAMTLRSRINYLLNLLLFAAVTAVIFSGILISQQAIPLLEGAKHAPDIDSHWDSLHNDFSQFLLLFAGFHLAINWEWMLAAAEKLSGRFRTAL